MNRYPTFNTESKKLVPRAIDVETLSEQLIPIRDAFLKVFDGARARSRGELHRLELGLTNGTGHDRVHRRRRPANLDAHPGEPTAVSESPVDGEVRCGQAA
jgi:hypothetical protein